MQFNAYMNFIAGFHSYKVEFPKLTVNRFEKLEYGSVSVP